MDLAGMMKGEVWIVTVHDGGGSMGEAMDVQWSCALPEKQHAEGLADALNTAFERRAQKAGAPWGNTQFAQCFPVRSLGEYNFPKPKGAALTALLAQHGGALPPGHHAIDVDALAEMIENDQELELLPPPPTAEEEAAALASILGNPR